MTTTTARSSTGRLLVHPRGDVLAADDTVMVQPLHITSWLRAGCAVLLCAATNPATAPCLDEDGLCTGHVGTTRAVLTGDRMVIGRRHTGRVVYQITAAGTAGILLTREA